MSEEKQYDEVLKDTASGFREEIKDLGQRVQALTNSIKACEAPVGDENKHLQSERIANSILCYRHLEDASMRLGKLLQAIGGGISPYGGTALNQDNEGMKK